MTAGNGKETPEDPFESGPNPSPENVTDEHAEELWFKEVEVRNREMDQGHVSGIPWIQARRNIMGS